MCVVKAHAAFKAVSASNTRRTRQQEVTEDPETCITFKAADMCIRIITFKADDMCIRRLYATPVLQVLLINPSSLNRHLHILHISSYVTCH